MIVELIPNKERDKYLACVDCDGNTALHYIAYKKKTNLLNFLKDFGPKASKIKNRKDHLTADELLLKKLDEPDVEESLSELSFSKQHSKKEKVNRTKEEKPDEPALGNNPPAIAVKQRKSHRGQRRGKGNGKSHPLTIKKAASDADHIPSSIASDKDKDNNTIILSDVKDDFKDHTVIDQSDIKLQQELPSSDPKVDIQINKHDNTSSKSDDAHPDKPRKPVPQQTYFPTYLHLLGSTASRRINTEQKQTTSVNNNSDMKSKSSTAFFRNESPNQRNLSNNHGILQSTRGGGTKSPPKLWGDYNDDDIDVINESYNYAVPDFLK